MSEPFYVPDSSLDHPVIDRARAQTHKITQTFAADLAGATLAARLAGLPMRECIKAMRITANMLERDKLDVVR